MEGGGNIEQSMEGDHSGSLVCSICSVSIDPAVHKIKRDVGEVVCHKCMLVAAAGADSEIIDPFSDPMAHRSPTRGESEFTPSEVPEDGSIAENEGRLYGYDDENPQQQDEDQSQPNQVAEEPSGILLRGKKRGKGGKLRGSARNASNLKQHGTSGKSRGRRSMFKRCVSLLFNRTRTNSFRGNSHTSPLNLTLLQLPQNTLISEGCTTKQGISWP